MEHKWKFKDFVYRDVAICEHCGIQRERLDYLTTYRWSEDGAIIKLRCNETPKCSKLNLK